MSDAPKSGTSVKRTTRRKSAKGAPFDPAEFLATAALGRDIFTYSKKDVIFAQGDDADSVFYIKKGKVKVSVVSKQGKEAVVAILGPDEFAGEGCLIGQPKRLATASAMNARQCEWTSPRLNLFSGGSLNFLKCLSHISWRGTPGWRKTSSISFSIQPRNG